MDEKYNELNQKILNMSQTYGSFSSDGEGLDFRGESVYNLFSLENVALKYTCYANRERESVSLYEIFEGEKKIYSCKTLDCVLSELDDFGVSQDLLERIELEAFDMNIKWHNLGKFG